jgi:hypothetical protein
MSIFSHREGRYAQQFRVEEDIVADPPQYEDSLSTVPSAFDASKPLAFIDEERRSTSKRVVKRSVSAAAAQRPGSACVSNGCRYVNM